MGKEEGILSKGHQVDEKYWVQFFIKRGSHAETYRVKGEKGNTFFLKLFHYSQLHPTQLDSEGRIKEIVFLRELEHPNIVQYRDSGEWHFKGKELAYLVLDFISGETLEEQLLREGSLSAHEVKRIAKGVLEGLEYLHGQEHPLVHNDINVQNVMRDMDAPLSAPRIIDFGYARLYTPSLNVYYRHDLNPFYLAPECFENEFSPRSDLFSVGCTIYHLLFGTPPWSIDGSEKAQGGPELEKKVLEARRSPLKFPAKNELEKDQELGQLLKVIEKALQENPEDRFLGARDMKESLEEEASHTGNSFFPVEHQGKQETDEKGGGFDDIAGMDTLKETLYNDVIRALEEKELYREYGLTIPNGMLLYGPPGCGKSFIAQKLAEEVEHHYVEVKPSDLASIYVHGSQEKIGQLFDEAKEKAPAILNFEEFDALVPRRDGNAGSHQSGEVNEFLTRLNNCGEEGIFVIASTNQPGLIDSAVLRAGRMDKMFFVPPPDYEARKEMFRLLLENRPIEEDIDYEALADRTQNFVSVDIEHIVNESARAALKEKKKISQGHLIEVIHASKPSLSEKDTVQYEAIREEIEGDGGGGRGRRPIGYKMGEDPE